MHYTLNLVITSLAVSNSCRAPSNPNCMGKKLVMAERILPIFPQLQTPFKAYERVEILYV